MVAPKELHVGDVAPHFTLRAQDGKTVRLADFKGTKNIVLVFYPGDMTPGCTMQLCAIRDDWPKFLQHDTVVFGMNHGDAESHKLFIKKHSLPFPLLVDAGKKVSARYGAVRMSFKTKIIKRTVVVVGKDGRIAFLKRGMPKDADILKAIPS